MTAQTTPQLPEEAITHIESQKILQEHKRERRLYILLPILLCVVLIIAVVVIALSLNRAGTSGIADIMLSFLCLFPLVICLFPLYLILVVANVLMIRATTPIYKGAESAREKSEGFNTRARHFFENLADKSVNLSVRLAPLEHFLGIFEHTHSQHDENGRK